MQAAAAGAIACGRRLVGSALFTLALNHKQMSLYWAPAFFAHLLGWALQQQGAARKVSDLIGFLLHTASFEYYPAAFGDLHHVARGHQLCQSFACSGGSYCKAGHGGRRHLCSVLGAVSHVSSSGAGGAAGENVLELIRMSKIASLDARLQALIGTSA